MNKKVLHIDKKLLSNLDKLLSCEECDFEKLISEFDMNCNGSIFNKAVYFNNNYYIEINIFRGSRNVSMYITLYDNDGEEIETIEPNYEQRLSGIHILKDYELNVVDK